MAWVRITSKSKSWRSENGKRSWRENWKVNRMQKMWKKERHDQKTWISVFADNVSETRLRKLVSRN